MDLKLQLVYAGVTEQYEDWLYKSIAFAAVAAIVTYLAVYFSSPVSVFALAGALAAFLLVGAVRIFSVIIRAKSRASEVERVLPDFLELVAGNVQSGMSAYDALKTSKRPEFGALNAEVDHALRRVKATKSLSKAFEEMSSRVDSNILARISRLFTTGVRSGAPLGAMLEEIASDTRDFLALRKETVTTVTAYSSFILLATVIGGPFLFASSVHFLRALGAASGGFALSEAPIVVPEIKDTKVMGYFAYAMIVISSTFVSLLLGLVRSGDEKNGLKYLPFILFAAVATFHLSSSLLQGFAPI